ncbi:MAG: UDP-N-acetylglucosamine 1-carboxyvinyltransferase [Planctomyces sp.]|nr:UDP-N-acetylglucosamine 1-carboxyvinyltransferase [Planctomyces sp.]
MDIFRIQGGRRLEGCVPVEGSKNACLPILAATISLNGTAVIERVPWLNDVQTMSELLKSIGVRVQRSAASQLTIDPSSAANPVAPYELVRKMRAGVCVLGPLLSRFGYACVSLPGGCNIGHRPIDLHLKGLGALGADIRIQQGYVIAECKRLSGADINLGGPFGSTVTGTCNVMVAAATARGQTIIRCAAMEPEVCDVGRFLIAAGAKIDGLGTPVIEIQGVEQLGHVHHSVITDRIEAGTLAIAIAMTHGKAEILNAPIADMTSTLSALREMNVIAEVKRPVAATDRQSDIGGEILEIDGTADHRSGDLVAQPYPGLPTDMQAQFMAMMCVTPGVSVVTDRVFPDRFIHAAELVRMGADIKVNNGSAVIRGVRTLSGACVMASDLRASAALVLAALAAEGESEIHRVYHLDRGYFEFEKKLNLLGGRVVREHAEE